MNKEELKRDLWWEIKNFYEGRFTEGELLDLLMSAYELGFEYGATEPIGWDDDEL